MGKRENAIAVIAVCDVIREIGVEARKDAFSISIIRSLSAQLDEKMWRMIDELDGVSSAEELPPEEG
jgi:hypothetical protein